MANIEILKENLSEETFTAVEAELKDKDIKLADLATGNYVSKEKYSALETQLNNTQTLLTNKNAEYDSLIAKAGDNDALKTELENLKNTSANEITTLKNQYEAKLKLAAVKTGIMQADAIDPDDIIPFVNMDKITVDDNGIIGLDEQIKSIKEKKAYLFKAKEKPGASGMQHGGSNEGADVAMMRKVMGLPPIK